VFAQSCILIFATNILLNQKHQKWKAGARKTFDRYAPIFQKDLQTIQAAELVFHPAIQKLSDQASRQVASVSELERELA